MKKNIKIAVLFLLTCLVLGFDKQKESKNILWVSSDINAQWKINSIEILNKKSDKENAIEIYTDSSLQVIDGFGACFNELGGKTLNSISEKKQKEILSSLFDTIKGCKFNLCRMPIGANDYAVNWYSHNETDQDFKMDNFSISRDMENLIPYIKKAKSINPKITIWASPWCPPSWMKTNKHYACMPDKVNDLAKEGEGKEMVSQFIMQKDYLQAYALYFSLFIREYQKQGIGISAVHVQNEPNSCQNFPSCIWRPEDLARFIGEYLGPKLKGDALKTEIWLGTIERPHFERVNDILKDENAKKYISGVGFQWAGKEAIPLISKNYPELRLMQTETECGDGSNDWKAAEHTFDLMKHYFSNGANSYMYWNMILDETGKSQWGWKQNSMISIDRKSKEVTYNPEFYLMKHFSSFIEKGATYIKTNDKNCLAFKNINNYVIVYYNPNDTISHKEFVINNKIFKVEVKPRSFNTFVI